MYKRQAEEYFKDLNAKEDRGEEEKFVPKPYYGGRSSTTKKAEKKKAEKPSAKAKEKPADTPTEAAPLDEQDVYKRQLFDRVLAGCRCAALMRWVRSPMFSHTIRRSCITSGGAVQFSRCM